MDRSIIVTRRKIMGMWDERWQKVSDNIATKTVLPVAPGLLLKS